MATRTIAILGTRGIPARYGGFETFAERLAIGLVERGSEVTVYCERSIATDDLPSSYRGVRLVHLAAPRAGPFTTIIFDLVCLWHARRGHDVVYMLGYGAAPFCWIPRWFGGARIWINVDGIEWRRAKWNWFGRTYLRLMERWATRVADLVVADAQAIHAHLVASYRRLPQVAVVPYGTDLVREAPVAPLARFGLAPGGYYLVVARLEPENHVRELVEGFLASRCDAPLVVVGSKDSPTPYVRALLALQGERVRFVGGVYESETLVALRYHARAYLHGHSVGGTNPSLLEAMGCGNLIIAHDNPFNREVLGDGARFFAAAADVPAAIDWVESFDAAAHAATGERMRDRAAAEYSWDRIVACYENMLASDRA
jgi:glycosyltransferase involved in cell wall biosynthesis